MAKLPEILQKLPGPDLPIKIIPGFVWGEFLKKIQKILCGGRVDGEMVPLFREIGDVAGRSDGANE